MLGATGSPSQPSVGKRKKLPVESVFNRFDDDEVDEAPRKRKLVPLDYEDEDKGSVGVEGAGAAGGKGANTEEKRKHIKSLIEKIPTAKPELFNYPLDWSVVDSVSISSCVCDSFSQQMLGFCFMGVCLWNCYDGWIQ